MGSLQTTHAVSAPSSSRSADRFAPLALPAEPTERRWRHLHAWNLMVRLLSEHLAGRLDLGAPNADLLEKRGQRVDTLRSSDENRSHAVLGAAETDGIHRCHMADGRTPPATDVQGKIGRASCKERGESRGGVGPGERDTT